MRGVLIFLVIFLFLGSIGVKGQILFGEEQIITIEVQFTNDIYAIDLDNDGDMDVLSASFYDNKIAWYENDGNGNFGNQNIITLMAEKPKSIHAADLDNDGDIDILSASLDGKIAWYKNNGNSNFGNQNIIFKEDAGTTSSIFATDLDNDGDIDIVFTNSLSPLYTYTTSWCKNDGIGNFSDPINLFSEIERPTSIHVADLEPDGDMDILAVSYWENKIVWYENDGIGNFESQLISSTEGATSIYSADLDNDGDMDVLATTSDNTNSWYQNNGDGSFSTRKIISNTILSQFIYAMDMDNDGDMDVLGSSSDNVGIVAGYENDGGANFVSQNIIRPQGQGASALYGVDLDNDGDKDVLLASHWENKISWYENLLNNTKIICFAFQDSNENGLYDNNEKPLSNQQIFLQPSPDASFTEHEGNTYFSVKNGEYQLSAEPNTIWELTTPKTYNITITDNYEPQTYYFGFKPTRILPRVKPHLNSSPTRCNTTANYWLHYSNTGTTIANGTITLAIDELMDFISANPEPDIVEENTLKWHFSELYPTYENKIQLQFQMPDFNTMGETLETQATVQIFNDNEELVYSKSTDYNSEVLCSYDPNDKLARSNLLGQSEFAYIQDTILYTVRFQNTGNDTAFNIRIEDVLDKKLDWTTFHPITASHDYRTELNRETGLVTFYFDDILLPDSTTNEPESHGFVMFGIASLENLEDKIEVDNTASIFFDFNPPIVTNTATLTLLRGDVGIEGIDNSYSILIRPNPFSDFTTIEVSGLSPSGNYRLDVRDILGKKVTELKVENGELILERGDLVSGLYLIQVLEENGKILGGGKVLVE